MSSAKYLIENSVFELQHASRAGASRCNSTLQSIMHSYILPEVEHVFDISIPSDLDIKLGKLEIDIGTIREEDLKLLLATKIKEALKKALYKKLSQNVVKNSKSLQLEKDTTHFHIRATETFLLYGYLPNWLAAHVTLQTLISASITKAPKLFHELLEGNKNNEAFLKRLVHSIQAAQFEAIVRLINETESPWIFNFNQALQNAKKHKELGHISAASFLGINQYIILSNLLNSRGPGFHKNRFIEAHFDRLRNVLKSDFNMFLQVFEKHIYNHHKEYLPHVNIQKFHREKESKVQVDPEAVNSVSHFIIQLNLNTFNPSTLVEEYPRQKIIHWLLNVQTKDFITRELTTAGLKNLLKLITKDTHTLYSFVEVFFHELQKFRFKNIKRHIDDSFAELLIKTALFTGHSKDAHQRNLTALCFLLDPVFDSNKHDVETQSLEHFIKNVSNFSPKEIKIERKKAAYVQFKRDYQSLLDNTSNQEIISVETSVFKEQISVAQKKLLIYFLNHGELPKDHDYLKQLDLEEVFIFFLKEKDEFFTSWLKSSSAIPHNVERLFLNASEAFTNTIHAYLKVSLRDLFCEFENYIKSINQSLDTLGHQPIPKSTLAVVFLNAIVKLGRGTSSRIFSLMVLSEVQRRLINQNNLTDLKSINLYAAQTAFLFADVQLKIGKLSSNEKRTIHELVAKKVVNYLATKSFKAVNSVYDDKAVASEILLYAKLYPSIFYDVLKTIPQEHLKLVTLFKYVLNSAQWEEFKSIIKPFPEIYRTIKTVEIETVSWFSTEEISTYHKLTTIQSFDELPKNSLNQVLVMGSRYEAEFKKLPFLNERNSWREHVFYGDKAQRDWLFEISKYHPASIINAFGLSFWNFLVFRFAVEIKLAQRRYTIAGLRRAFLSYLYTALQARKQVAVYYNFVDEISSDKNTEFGFRLRNTSNEDCKKLDKSALNISEYQLADWKSVQQNSIQFEYVLREILQKPHLLIKCFRSKKIKQFIRGILKHKTNVNLHTISSTYFAKTLLSYSISVILNQKEISPLTFGVLYIKSLFEQCLRNRQMEIFDALLQDLKTSSNISIVEVTQIYEKEMTPMFARRNNLRLDKRENDSDGVFTDWKVLSRGEQKNRLKYILKNHNAFEKAFVSLSQALPKEVIVKTGTSAEILQALFQFTPIGIKTKQWKRAIFEYSINLALKAANKTQKGLAIDVFQLLWNLVPPNVKSENFQIILAQFEDTTVIPIKRLFTQLEQRTTQEFIDTFDGFIMEKSHVEQQTKDSKAISIFLFYNDKGYLPWWSEVDTINDVIEDMAVFSISNPTRFEKEMEVFTSEELSFNTFIFQLSEHTLNKLQTVFKRHLDLSLKFTSAYQLYQSNGKGELSQSFNQTKSSSSSNRELVRKFQTSDMDEPTLQKLIYLLPQDELIGYLPISSETLKAEILEYLALSSFFYMVGLNPAKWRVIVYMFVFQKYSTAAGTNLSKFRTAFNLYLKQTYAKYEWDKIFQTIHESLQTSNTYKIKTVPEGLMEFVHSTTQKQHEKIKAVSEDITRLIEIGDAVNIKISNAGLILIWPFLTRLFEQLKLLKQTKFIDREAQNRAVYILQYIAQNQILFPEYALVLNKILVGLKVEEHLEIISELTDDERNTATSLINGLKMNWEKMKSTTIEGIQETFLQREGTITFKEDRTLLSVEKKGVDVLLSDISWNINTVKLPWMHKPLYITWL